MIIGLGKKSIKSTEIKMGKKRKKKKKKRKKEKGKKKKKKKKVKLSAETVQRPVWFP